MPGCAACPVVMLTDACSLKNDRCKRLESMLGNVAVCLAFSNPRISVLGASPVQLFRYEPARCWCQSSEAARRHRQEAPVSITRVQRLFNAIACGGDSDLSAASNQFNQLERATSCN